MDRGAWQATVHGVAKSRHDRVTQHSTAHACIASADALKSLAAAAVPCFLFSFHFTSLSYKKDVSCPPSRRREAHRISLSVTSRHQVET